jgi:hypothetical protein
MRKHSWDISAETNLPRIINDIQNGFHPKKMIMLSDDGIITSIGNV